MNTTAVSYTYSPSRANSFIFMFLALALSLTFPQLFHTLGIGSRFLPLFLPTVFIALLAPLPFVVGTTLLTPLLNTLLFHMPPWHITLLLMVELTVVGCGIAVLRRKFPLWLVLPGVFIIERVLVYLLTTLVPAIGINPSVILASYPGVILNSVIGIFISHFFIEEK